MTSPWSPRGGPLGIPGRCSGRSCWIRPSSIAAARSRPARDPQPVRADRVRAGTSLLIFPEGTRSPTQTLFASRHFHLAAQAGSPCCRWCCATPVRCCPGTGTRSAPASSRCRCCPGDRLGRGQPAKQGLDAAIADLHAAYRRTLADWIARDRHLFEEGTMRESGVRRSRTSRTPTRATAPRGRRPRSGAAARPSSSRRPCGAPSGTRSPRPSAV